MSPRQGPHVIGAPLAGFSRGDRHPLVGFGRHVGLLDVGDVTFLGLDVTSDASVANAVQQVLEEYGRRRPGQQRRRGLDGAAEETSVVQAQDMFDTNAFGVMRMVT
ncbi:hypothetical protein [Streptomyces sp. NBC_01373]|uniref:hypothetical protein n=1 Tax=Streptomyces sp. NBC_01373 TaxID=2903843 RepID=UPI00224D6256|nr:hypothetical protein [Streptomyces sp. NBC_01373]MCX4706856.1 hypothetical protein [Streptomyces sp. NBC_01373]